MRVIVESPFGTRPDGSRASPDELQRNITYARRALLDSLKRGEAPYASHLLYPQVLEDATPAEREQGIQAGFEYGKVAELVGVYNDYNTTPGMRRGIDRARYACQEVVYRYIGKNL